MQVQSELNLGERHPGDQGDGGALAVEARDAGSIGMILWVQPSGLAGGWRRVARAGVGGHNQDSCEAEAGA